jgi:hypothetical protein
MLESHPKSNRLPHNFLGGKRGADGQSPVIRLARLQRHIFDGVFFTSHFSSMLHINNRIIGSPIPIAIVAHIRLQSLLFFIHVSDRRIDNEILVIASERMRVLARLYPFRENENGEEQQLR